MLRFVSGLFDEFMYRVRRHEIRFWAVCASAVAGIVVGIVLYKLPAAYWWQNNRWNFATKLLCEGFGSVAISLLLSGILVCVTSLMSSLKSYLTAICFVAAFLCGMYAVGIVCAISTISVVSCVLYTLLFLSVELVGNIIFMIFVACDEACEKTFIQAICGLKTLLIAYLVVYIVKILLIFAVLRPIIGLI